jgi:hypothetical protein
MMRPRKRNVGPILLAALGVGIMLTGLALHWWKPDIHDLEWIPQLVGAVIAFVGFYAMDPDGALKGGGFIVEAGTKIIAVIRTGNRASDPVVTVTKEVEPSEPPTVSVALPAPAEPLSNPVQWKDGKEEGTI